jgi:hypothetical protein
MRYLRTNTAVRVTVGPVFDKTDGVTPKTALTVTSCKLTLVVDDANVPTLVLDVAPTASGGANDMVHVPGDDAGFYDLELAAANVNYLGRAMLAITDAATHCPVFHEFMIVPAVVYDAMVLGTDLLDVSVTQWLGTAVATPTVAGVPEVDITHVNGVVAKDTNQRAGTAAAGAAGSITLDAGASSVDDIYVPCLVAIVAGTGAKQAAVWGRDYVGSTKVLSVTPNFRVTPDNTSEFVLTPCPSGWDELIADHLAANTTGAKLNTAGSAGDPLANAVPGAYGAGTAGKVIGDYLTGNAYTRLGAPAGASVSADIAAIEAQTDDIGAAGAGLTAVPWNTAWDAEVQSEVADALDAAVPGSPTANSINERIKTMDDANIPGALATIDDFVDTEVAAVLAAVDTEVAAIKAKTDNLPADPADSSDIAAAFAAVPAAVLGAGTRTLTAFSFAVDISAAAVTLIWDKATSAITAAGSIGKRLVDYLTGDIFARLGAPAGASVSADIAAAKADTAAIKTKVDVLHDTRIPGVVQPQTGDAYARLGAPAGASHAADIAAVKTETSNIQADTNDLQARTPAALVGGRTDASVGAVAAGAITDAAFHADADKYQAKVVLLKDDTGAADRYTVNFFKNGQPVTTGITSPTLQVIKVADGADLIAATALTEVGTGNYRYTATTTQRITAGAAYDALISATIGGSARTWRQPVGRDT